MNKSKSIFTYISLMLTMNLVLAEAPVSEPESWSFPEVVEHAREITPTNTEGKSFNQFGLVYSPQDTASIKLSSLPADELQKYADIVTHAYPDAVAKQLPEKCDSLPVENLNEAAVAGVAYISINATSQSARKSAANCLMAIQSNFAKVGR